MYSRKLSKYSGEKLAQGQRATVYEIMEPKGHFHGKVARVTHLNPGRASPLEKSLFYSFKIAKALFPNNFIEVNEATNRTKTRIGILLSKKVDLDPNSVSIVKQFLSNPKDLTRMFTHPSKELFTHLWRIKAIDPLIEKMALEGIIVNTHPVNILFDVKGNPIFFDIHQIDTGVLLANKNLPEKVKRFAQRLEKQ